ncbi:MAG: MGH1-like glycoside hydrolase domain-containing protein, partial [Candidatus Heimdallarchaeaceae archaeon]
MSQRLEEEVTRVLTANSNEITLNIHNKEAQTTFTSPSPGVYDQQWFWDSCLHSLVWLKLGNKERALQELESLVIGKKNKDFFPHMIFWKKKRDVYWRFFDKLYPTDNFSELIQPPIIGFPLKCLESAGIEKIQLDRLVKEISKHHNFVFEKRDPEKMGMITIIHPWESGLDSSPSFDLGLESKKPLRYHLWMRMRSLLKEFQRMEWKQKQMALKSSFRVKCVLTNSLLAWGLDSFADVLENVNLMEEAFEHREKSDRIWESLIRYCWNEKDGLFYNLKMKNEDYEQIPVNTISSLMPLMLDIPSEIKDRLIEHLLDKTEYWSKYPIPTVSMIEKTFDPANNKLLWRGPTWINTNFFIWLGLKKHKENKIADELAKKSLEL